MSTTTNDKPTPTLADVIDAARHYGQINFAVSVQNRAERLDRLARAWLGGVLADLLAGAEASGAVLPKAPAKIVASSPTDEERAADCLSWMSARDGTAAYLRVCGSPTHSSTAIKLATTRESEVKDFLARARRQLAAAFASVRADAAPPPPRAVNEPAAAPPHAETLWLREALPPRGEPTGWWKNYPDCFGGMSVTCQRPDCRRCDDMRREMGRHWDENLLAVIEFLRGGRRHGLPAAHAHARAAGRGAAAEVLGGSRVRVVRNRTGDVLLDARV